MRKTNKIILVSLIVTLVIGLAGTGIALAQNRAESGSANVISAEPAIAISGPTEFVNVRNDRLKGKNKFP